MTKLSNALTQTTLMAYGKLWNNYIATNYFYFFFEI